MIYIFSFPFLCFLSGPPPYWPGLAGFEVLPTHCMRMPSLKTKQVAPGTSRRGLAVLLSPAPIFLYIYILYILYERCLRGEVKYGNTAVRVRWGP